MNDRPTGLGQSLRLLDDLHHVEGLDALRSARDSMRHRVPRWSMRIGRLPSLIAGAVPAAGKKETASGAHPEPGEDGRRRRFLPPGLAAA
jgi:hypothetical protein